MKTYKTEQENFWAGEFGDNYIKRNDDKEIVASNLALFSKVFALTNGIASVMEFGSNIGMNIQAIKHLLPHAELSAVEINKLAVEQLKKIDSLSIYNESILDFSKPNSIDFVFIKGVLIHIDPDSLQVAYKNLYDTSKKYIFLAEYYNPTPVEIPYRGHEKKLFKRDFAGEMMDLYPDLKLISYGCTYHRDPVYLQSDDSTWFLMEKGL